MPAPRLRVSLALLALSPCCSLPLQAAPLDLPFTLHEGLPLVRARIDGREARLLIDSGGAAALALRPDEFPQDAAPGASAPDSRDPQGRRRENRELGLRTVELEGQLLPSGLQARSWAKSPTPPGVDGYLGWGWLSRQRWLIDYEARRLRLLDEDEPLPAACGSQPQRLELLGSLPYVRLTTADGTPLALGLDTGASRNVIQTARLADVSPGSITLGTQSLSPGEFVGAALQVPVVSGFLGWDFFSRYRVCVDPRRQMLWVQPLQPLRPQRASSPP